MIRFSRLAAILATAVSAALAHAHFTFIVPGNSSDVRIFLSETLVPEEGIPVDLLANAKLLARSAEGKDAPLTLARLADGTGYGASLPADTAVIHGSHDLGVSQRGGSKTHWLQYYPKTVLGDAFAKPIIVGEAPVELVPGGAPGGVRLRYLVDGKPKANVDLTVVLPDGTSREVKTDDEGNTPAFEQTGRYAAWARDWIDQAGEHDGKSYEQVRRYATLVFDAGVSQPAAAAAPPTSQPVAAAAVPSQRSERRNPHAFGRPRPAPTKAVPFGVALPEATSSFGAVAVDGWLYVYGGHIAPTHDYSTKAVSGQFHRLDLAEGKTWSALPGGPGLQGMNLAAHAGRIYRVGGMQPVNAPGEPVDNRSIVDAEVFDPAAGAWRALPPLPEPRSSHDVAVIGDTLFVVGGWNLQGGMTDAESWADTTLALDLRDPAKGWVAIPQPFQRRAIIAAVYGGKLFVIGGFDADDRPSRRVDIFDPVTRTWSRGPGLPGEPITGFSPAACVQDNRLFVSVGDGSLHQLNDAEYTWETVGVSTPRIVHRLVPYGSRVLILGGAIRGDNLDLIEAITIAPARPAARPAEVASAGRAPSNPVRAAAPQRLSPAVAAAVERQTHCPVMRDDEVDADSVTVIYRGVPVRLCCSTCVRRWAANPEKYADASILPQLGVAAEASGRAGAED